MQKLMRGVVDCLELGKWELSQILYGEYLHRFSPRTLILPLPKAAFSFTKLIARRKETDTVCRGHRPQVRNPRSGWRSGVRVASLGSGTQDGHCLSPFGQECIAHTGIFHAVNITNSVTKGLFFS